MIDPWMYNGEQFIEIIDEFEAFVYLIERLNIDEDPHSPIFYIGKKVFVAKGGKESSWQSYYGSSKPLKIDLERYGRDNFRRTILHLCRTRGDAGYLEIKEQIDRDVLNPDKFYYNRAIFGRYYVSPDIYEPFDCKDFSSVEHSSKGTKWVTTGKINKKIHQNKVSKFLRENPKWSLGKCKKQIKFNDGVENFFGLEVPLDMKKGWITKRVTDGHNNKLFPIQEIPDFLQNNKGWKIGFSGNKDMVWITDGEEELKIKADTFNDYPDFILGRSGDATRGRISIFKDGKYKFIKPEEITDYPGWIRKSSAEGKVCSESTRKKLSEAHDGHSTTKDKVSMFKNDVYKFIDKNIIDKMLEDGWVIRGAGLGRKCSTETKDRLSKIKKNIVSCRDLRDGVFKQVSSNEFRSNEYYVGLRSKAANY